MENKLKEGILSLIQDFEYETGRKVKAIALVDKKVVRRKPYARLATETLVTESVEITMDEENV